MPFAGNVKLRKGSLTLISPPLKLKVGMMAVLLMTVVPVRVLTRLRMNSWGRPPSKPGLHSMSRVRALPTLALQP